jgi:hypothetical protein
MARACTLDAVKFGTCKNARWRIPLSRLVPSEPYHHLFMVNLNAGTPPAMTETRIRLKYFDQNEAMAPLFPMTGTLRRAFTSTNGTTGWHVVWLDKSFPYGGRRHQRVVIRSRWDGYEVGGPEPTSVFFLLIPDPSVLDVDEVDIDILLNDGEHIDAVAGVLGHESIDTTRKQYAFASEERRRATINAFKV